MGCGPSRVNIDKLRIRRRKSSTNTAQHDKATNHQKTTNKQTNDRGHYSSIRRKSPTDYYVQRTSHLTEDIGIAKKRIANKIRPISGPLQPPLGASTGSGRHSSRHRSSSQIDFFRMLDEKIANGKDFSEDEEEVELPKCRTSVGSKSHRRRSGSRTSVSGHSRKDVIIGEPSVVS